MTNVQHSPFARRAVAALFLLLGTTACDEQNSLVPPSMAAQTSAPVARITVTSDLLTLRAGEVVEILVPGGLDPAAQVRWSSDDASIAEVDASGTISARSVGTTTVTVSEAGKATDILVTVMPTDSVEVEQ
jgi:hypothetical protein